MTIRYEANPPKITPDTNPQKAISEFVMKIKSIAPMCDAVHLTENVLGHRRIPPGVIGKILQKEVPDLPVTASLRVRDKSLDDIERLVGEYAELGFSGVLVLMGDPSRDGVPDSGQVPSSVVRHLESSKLYDQIDLYLSISNTPNVARIQKKINAAPKGFITQVVQSPQQVQNIADSIRGFSIIPIVLFPSEKNQKSAKFLGLDMSEYGDDFAGFLDAIRRITGDVLITSPGDFAGLCRFLDGL